MKKTTKKRGRPPVDDPASERLELRVTKEQRDRWQRAAEKAELALSAWIKRILDRNS